jgi:CRP/FNR family transcriptional regulator, anaerobic regulatory protein
MVLKRFFTTFADCLHLNNSNMYNQIITNIKSIMPLNAVEEAAFIKILSIKKFKKKEFLLQEGKICNKIFFINSGYTRVFYNVDGIENTAQFFFAGTWYTDYESFLTEQPTVENVQALEACEVVQFLKSDLYKLYIEYPIFQQLGRIQAENAYVSLLKRNKMIANEEPQERYLNLLKQRPELVDKIPQHYIAAYLGIKPESLSRIRKRIHDAAVKKHASFL